MARLYREAPLNSVWEGTSNMMCMDVRRAMIKDRRTRDAFIAEISKAKGSDRRFDAFLDHTARLMDAACEDEYLARPATEAMARALQGAELIRHSTQDTSDAFISSRLSALTGSWGCMFGTLGIGSDIALAHRIVRRARVVPV